MGVFTRKESGVPVAPKPSKPAEADAIAPLPGTTTNPAAPAAPASPAAPTMKPPSRTSMVQPAPPTERQIYFQQLKVRIHQQLVERLDVQNLRSLPPDTVRTEVRILIRELCQNEKS